MRCYLDAVGILKDDELNREKAAEMAWATAEDTLDECVKEVAGKIKNWNYHSIHTILINSFYIQNERIHAKKPTS